MKSIAKIVIILLSAEFTMANLRAVYTEDKVENMAQARQDGVAAMKNTNRFLVEEEKLHAHVKAAKVKSQTTEEVDMVALNEKMFELSDALKKIKVKAGN